MRANAVPLCWFFSVFSWDHWVCFTLSNRKKVGLFFFLYKAVQSQVPHRHFCLLTWNTRVTAAHMSLAVARPPRLLQQPLRRGRTPPGDRCIIMMLKLAKLKVLSRNLISRSLSLFSKWWLTLSNYVFRLLPWCVCVYVSLCVCVCVGEKRPGRPNNTANGKSLRGWRRVLSGKKKKKKSCVKKMTNRAWEVRPALVIQRYISYCGRTKEAWKVNIWRFGPLTEDNVFSPKLSANGHLCHVKPSE